MTKPNISRISIVLTSKLLLC